MNIGLNPQYEKYANQELNWLPMDTESLYNENLKNKYNLLQKYNWINNPFTYKFNSSGFRSDEFDESEPSIVFLGCSITVGIGIPYKTTWSKIVSNKLNLKCYNLGVGGSSNDTAFRHAYTWLGKLKPSICVFCQTFNDRMEIWKGTDVVFNVAETHPYFYLSTWQSNPLNKTLLAEKNLLAIKQICNQYNIKFVHADVQDIELDASARDLAHPGIESNLEFSKLILSKI
jgi:hypothetical protein